MHRSQVNEILVESETFIRSHGYIMPPFAYWSPERMRAEDAIDIRARGLGWVGTSPTMVLVDLKRWDYFCSQSATGPSMIWLRAKGCSMQKKL